MCAQVVLVSPNFAPLFSYVVRQLTFHKGQASTLIKSRSILGCTSQLNIPCLFICILSSPLQHRFDFHHVTCCNDAMFWRVSSSPLDYVLLYENADKQYDHTGFHFLTEK
jgi:hypothetical protein